MAKYTVTIGSRRTRVFDVGEARLASAQAGVGDRLTDDLVSNMTDDGLDRFSGALAKRGLEFGDVDEIDPTAEWPHVWLVYPIGDPSAVFP